MSFHDNYGGANTNFKEDNAVLIKRKFHTNQLIFMKDD